MRGPCPSSVPVQCLWWKQQNHWSWYTTSLHLYLSRVQFLNVKVVESLCSFLLLSLILSSALFPSLLPFLHLLPSCSFPPFHPSCLECSLSLVTKITLGNVPLEFISFLFGSPQHNYLFMGYYFDKSMFHNPMANYWYRQSIQFF